jgi:hypothetical protein
VVASDVAAPQWWLRVRLVAEAEAMRERLPEAARELFEKHVAQRVCDYLVEATPIAGIAGVAEATARELKEHRPAPEVPAVDPTRTFSNDITEVYATLGLEAAVFTLANELADTLMHDGRYINKNHVCTIVGTMTMRGALMPLSRHGINRVETAGPLVRCSFEETIDTLFEAAVFGDFDEVRGVTTSIMLGQTAHIGSGTMQLLNLPPEQMERSRTAVASRCARQRASGRPPARAELRDLKKVVCSRMRYADAEGGGSSAPAVLASLAMCDTKLFAAARAPQDRQARPARAKRPRSAQGLVGDPSPRAFDRPYYQTSETAQGPAEGAGDASRLLRGGCSLTEFVQGETVARAVVERQARREQNGEEAEEAEEAPAAPAPTAPEQTVQTEQSEADGEGRAPPKARRR